MKPPFRMIGSLCVPAQFDSVLICPPHQAKILAQIEADKIARRAQASGGGGGARESSVVDPEWFFPGSGYEF